MKCGRKIVIPCLVFSGLSFAGTRSSAQAVFQEQIKLKSPLVQQDALFGSAVAAYGDTLVVGAYNEGRIVGSLAGAVYVFQAEGPGDWDLVRKLSPWPFVIWAGLSVDIEGDVIAAGSSNGGVGLFKRNVGGPNAWGRVQIVFPPPQPCCSSEYGWSVALSGEWLFVGDPMREVPPLPNGPGKVFIFRKQPLEDNWVFFKEIEGDPFMGLGNGIAAEGDLVAVSGLAGGTEVWLFDRNLGGPDNFGLVKAFAGTPLGIPRSLDLGDDRLLVGDWNNTGGIGGGARIFERDLGGPDNWGLAASFLATVPQDALGYSVALQDDLAFVGSPSIFFGGNEGRVYVCARRNGTWEPAGILEAGDGMLGNAFGSALAATRSTLFVGAQNDSEGQQRSGAAYVLPWKPLGRVLGPPRNGGTRSF